MSNSFENTIVEKFSEYYGMSEDELFRELSVPPSTAKSRLYLLAKAIVGSSTEATRALDQGSFELKTVRLERDGSLKESMSFKQIDYVKIVREEWESSYLRDTLTKRFLLVIFQKDRHEIPRLRKIKFWSMPAEDLEAAKRFWEHTRRNIRANDFDHFIAQSDDLICHVRPKARNSKDLAPTASGGRAKKKAYWLNSEYVHRIIQ